MNSIENVKPKKRKYRKPKLNDSLMKDSLRLDMELSKYMLYEYTMQTTMTEAAFNLADKRKLGDYVR